MVVPSFEESTTRLLFIVQEAFPGDSAHSFAIMLTSLLFPRLLALSNILSATSAAAITTSISTATPTPTANSIATPPPIQSGMVGGCDAFYLVKSGDQCGTIASANDITLDQLYA